MLVADNFPHSAGHELCVIVLKVGLHCQTQAREAFGMTWPEYEPATYRMRGGHANKANPTW